MLSGIDSLVRSAREGSGYANDSYYLNAKLYIINFKKSGEWTEDNCGYRQFAGLFGMMNACDVMPQGCRETGIGKSIVLPCCFLV